PGPDSDIWNRVRSRVLHDELVLLHLCVAIRFAADARVRLNWTRLVQDPAARLIAIRVDGEGADIHEAFERAVAKNRIQEIARRHDGIHERVSKRFLARP